MKILFQIRPNAFSQRGGDTVDLERISSGLSALGAKIKIDIDNSSNLKDFDCVFLFNFTLPQLLKQQAEKAKAAGVPYVVLALNEDIPSFHAQSHLSAAVLVEYVKAGQPKEKFAELYPNPWTVTPAPRFENEWAARNAALVFTTGKRESRVLQQYYPGLNNLCALPLGFDLMQAGNAAQFEQEFGIKDFVLSVGRIESRKNQLMLLKALENESLPVVIASGGFTYQPEYDQAVRSFKRAGRTLILEKLSPAQLANAYAAAKIHALPSWYELPGLVSMEAASCGKNVVVSDMGTTRDYFEDSAFYADPASADSIKNAVIAAYHSAPIADLKEKVLGFSWDETALHVFAALKAILPLADDAQQRSSLNFTNHSGSVIEQAEQLARAGDLNSALELIVTSKQTDSNNAALWRAEGMLLIAMQRFAEAKSLLDKAQQMDPKDSRIVCGLGICAKQTSQAKAGHDLFVAALALDPDNKVALLQLLSVAYELNDFTALEVHLRKYISSHADELDLVYALAGCLFRQAKFEEAQTYSQDILAKDSGHRGAGELLSLIKQELGKRPISAQQSINSNPSNLTTNSAIPGKTQESSKNLDKILRISELKRNHKITEGLQECTELLGILKIDAPELEEVYALHGELLALHGEIAESERRFNGILSQYPNSVRALCGLGALFGEQQNWSKAEEYFRKAINLNANCDVAFAGLALSSLNRGDKEAAWHYYDKALAVNPENLRAVFGILELGYPQARYNDIERVLKNYLELHPANLDFLYSLAGCFYAQNKLSEATQEVEKILIFSPGHPRAIELRQAIQTRQAR